MTLINREDAIDELRHLIPYKKYHRGEWVYLLDKKEVFKAINALPSAEAEWIPCSERLPSDSGNYLITVADLRLGHNGEHTVTIADFYAKAKKWNSVVDVYAWKPLPEPYKGGEEE